MASMLGVFVGLALLVTVTGTAAPRTVRPLKPGDLPATYALGYEWDSFGRLLSVDYPDGETLRYAYNGGGLLSSAVGHRPWAAQTEEYLAEARYDEFGQRTFVRYGNGATTRTTYEPRTRRLSTLATRLAGPSGQQIQNLQYGYSPVGNIRDVSNVLPQPLLETIFQKRGVSIAVSAAV
jgi:YD repeat-containing protein